jgi:hypothetical protein
MLRSESASSSQIENLTARARNIAAAEIDKAAPLNSRELGNVWMICLLLQNSSLPISIGILNQINKYYSALQCFQKGDYGQIIRSISRSIVSAVIISKKFIEELDLVLERWEKKITARRDSEIWKLLYLLVENPVISSKLLSDKLSISERSAEQLINEALKKEIIFSMKRYNKQPFYEAKEITDLLDLISKDPVIQRAKLS